MDIATALGTAKTVTDLLGSLSETLRKEDPDLATARAQIGELQQATYELQMENLGLQGQVGKLELEIGQMKLKLASDEEWKKHLSSVKEFHAPGGAVVFKKKDADIYYCPTCHAQRLPIPLQPRASGHYACQKCPNSGYQIDPHTSSFGVLQRRPTR